MLPLEGKNVVVVGASEGAGREIVVASKAAGAARVLAVARRPAPLAQLADQVPGAITLSADATEDGAADRVFQTLLPDVLVVCGGARPTMAPVQEQSWAEFSGNWDADVKASFGFCKAALQKPLAPGATVVLVSSGAGFAGSHLSGGYAGAKRMQMFLAEYCQKQSDRLRLGIRFLAVVPMRIMPGTGVGNVAVAGYSQSLGISESEFIADMQPLLTPTHVADVLIRLVCETPRREGSVFSVSAADTEAVASAT